MSERLLPTHHVIACSVNLHPWVRERERERRNQRLSIMRRRIHVMLEREKEREGLKG
jgi:hypothetical protein